MVIFYLLCNIMYKIHINVNNRQTLELCSVMNNQQIMYNRIIDNLDAAIIVENTKVGLQYFNTKGIEFLNLAAALLPNNEKFIKFI